MTSNVEKPRGSSSSTAMAADPNPELLLAIGRKLVQELNLDRTDTLCEWMAHYIAELLERETSCAPNERDAVRQQCFEAILRLWSHRAALPNGKRPLESFEPILRALESLDPESAQPRYHRVILGLHADVEIPPEPEVKSLFEFVRRVDDAARITIGHALAEAAKLTKDKDHEWVALAEDAADDGGMHILLIHYLDKFEGGEDASKEQKDADKAVLSERIKRLKMFVEAASQTLVALQARIS